MNRRMIASALATVVVLAAAAAEQLGITRLSSSPAIMIGDDPYAVIGILSGLEGKLAFVTALVRQLRLQGVLVGSRRHQMDMINAIDATGLRPVIDRSFPLEGIVDAFRYQESNQHFGKICLEW